MIPARPLLLAAAAALLSSAARAQPVLVDRAVRVAGLWCFPLSADTTRFVYLPNAARLATDEHGAPQFSFLRYALPSTAAPREGAAVGEAAGGGLLHFVVVYETPPEVVKEAAEALRDRFGDGATLRGPVVFTQGRYTLVSSLVGGDASAASAASAARSVLASGTAPVLEGNRLALSFALSPVQTLLLDRSLRMAASDVSLAFEMTFAGLSDAYDAELTVDWAQVQRAFAWEAGTTIYVVGLQAAQKFDELRRTGGIKLRASGDHEATEALVAAAYDRLAAMMFRPVTPEDVPAAERGPLAELLATALDPTNVARMTGAAAGFSLTASFRMTELRTSGTSVLDFSRRATVQRAATIVFNLAPARSLLDDSSHTRTVSIDDADFRERQVYVSIDGSVLPELGRAIENVTVTLRKAHGDGTESVRQLVLDAAALRRDSARARLAYPWASDTDRLAWLAYDYRARWSFRGGGAYETPWARSDAAMISLHTPYERRTVQIVGDARALAARGVRAVIVQVEYPFFGERRREQRLLRPGAAAGAGDDPAVELTLPHGVYRYEYAITWQHADGRRVTTRGSDDSGVLFVDDVPAASDARPPAAPLPRPTT